MKHDDDDKRGTLSHKEASPASKHKHESDAEQQAGMRAGGDAARSNAAKLSQPSSTEMKKAEQPPQMATSKKRKSHEATLAVAAEAAAVEQKAAAQSKSQLKKGDAQQASTELLADVQKNVKAHKTGATSPTENAVRKRRKTDESSPMQLDTQMKDESKGKSAPVYVSEDDETYEALSEPEFINPAEWESDSDSITALSDGLVLHSRADPAAGRDLNYPKTGVMPLAVDKHKASTSSNVSFSGGTSGVEGAHRSTANTSLSNQPGRETLRGKLGNGTTDGASASSYDSVSNKDAVQKGALSALASAAVAQLSSQGNSSFSAHAATSGRVAKSKPFASAATAGTKATDKKAGGGVKKNGSGSNNSSSAQSANTNLGKPSSSMTTSTSPAASKTVPVGSALGPDQTSQSMSEEERRQLELQLQQQQLQQMQMQQQQHEHQVLHQVTPLSHLHQQHLLHQRNQLAQHQQHHLQQLQGQEQLQQQKLHLAQQQMQQQQQQALQQQPQQQQQQIHLTQQQIHITPALQLHHQIQVHSNNPGVNGNILQLHPANPFAEQQQATPLVHPNAVGGKVPVPRVGGGLPGGTGERSAMRHVEIAHLIMRAQKQKLQQIRLAQKQHPHHQQQHPGMVQVHGQVGQHQHNLNMNYRFPFSGPGSGMSGQNANMLNKVAHAAGQMGLMGENSPASSQMNDRLGASGTQLAPLATSAGFQAMGANVALQAGPLGVGHVGPVHAPWPSGGSMHMHQHNQVRSLMLTPVSAVSTAMRPAASMSMADASSPKSGAVIRPLASAIHGTNNIIDLTSEPKASSAQASSAPAASKAAHGNQSAS